MYFCFWAPSRIVKCVWNVRQVMKATLKTKQLAILYFSPKNVFIKPQMQPFRGALRKRCAENMQQIYRRTLMPRCDFNFIKVAVRQGCCSANLLHIFRTPFPKNTSGGLLLKACLLRAYQTFRCLCALLPRKTY